MSKPFSQACDNNKEPILSILSDAFATSRNVLEIGSGTGQHAVYFAARLAHLSWQPSDLRENLYGIEQWRIDAALPNVRESVAFDVRDGCLPSGDYDAVFSANTLHIMAWPQVEQTFALLAKLSSCHDLCIYGPFNYNGAFTSDSNARFNNWLQQRDPNSAIRDFEAVDALAQNAGFLLHKDHPMPANNRLLHWVRA